MCPTLAYVKEDCCIDILGSTQLKFDVKVQLQDLPFPTPPSATSSTATALAHPPLPTRRSNSTSNANADREPPCLTHSHSPFFSLTPSRNSEIKLRASSTHRRISLRSAGWPSRSLACSFVCRSALTTASSSPLCLVSLPPSKGTREPARPPPSAPAHGQPAQPVINTHITHLQLPVRRKALLAPPRDPESRSPAAPRSKLPFAQLSDHAPSE